MLRICLPLLVALALAHICAGRELLRRRPLNRPYPSQRRATFRRENANRIAAEEASEAASDSFSLPLYSIGQVDETFQFEAIIGTPAQRLNLTLVSWYTDYIMSRNVSQNKYKCLSPDTNEAFFDETKSSTFWIDTQHGKGLKRETSPYDPDIGDKTMSDAPFPIAQSAWGRPTQAWKSAGFFSIAPYFMQDQLVFTFLQLFKNPQLSVHIKSSDTKNELSSIGGQITFGGKDAANCDTKWIPSTADIRENVELRVTKVSFGNITIETRSTAAIEYQTAYILTGSRKTLQKVVNLVGASYDPPSDTYQVDCDKRETLPDFVVSFQTLDYHVRPTDYVRKLRPADKLCTLMFSHTSVRSDNFWALGTSFTRPYCQLYDYKTEQLFFAKALN